MLRVIGFVAWFLALFAVPAAAMSLSSPDIADSAAIKAQQIYPRCGGANVSPALSWTTPPAATRSFALTMIDQDVKPSKWSHWIIVDLPLSARGLPRQVALLPGAARGIVNNFGDAGYDGPCPPPRSGTHHYVITLWALPSQDAPDIAPDEKATHIEAAFDKAAIAKASLTGFVAAP